LTDPTKRGGKWDIDEFFATGRAEIDSVLDYVRSLPVELKRTRALDFGCGVGRLTQALCRHFVECHGVDIAPSMIGLAAKYNRFGAKCLYHLNDAPNLALFADDTFDFVYSNIALQHIRPEYSVGYIAEFMRLLVPGGVSIFQLPSEPTDAPGVTMNAVALPDAGFKAQITIVDAPATLCARTQVTITARVKNSSDVVWPITWLPDGRYRIQLGNHWLDEDGRMIQESDGRMPLPHDMQPGEEVELQLPIHVPEINGAYVLELDVVQELVAWFRDRGSASATVCIQVVDGQPGPRSLSPAKVSWLDRVRGVVARVFHFTSDPAAAKPPVAQPVMETYGIPKPQVVELLERAGGRVVDVQRYDVCGPYWISYRYCVTK
jgi:SAM-dependent methyltransferase